VTDLLSLTAVIAACVAVVVAALTYLEARRQRRLTEVMVNSLAFIEGSGKRRRSSRPRTPKLTSPATPSSPSPSPQELQRLDLARRREERKQLELQLRQQREQWKRQKDVAKAIGWILDRMGSDDEDDEE